MGIIVEVFRLRAKVSTLLSLKLGVPFEQMTLVITFFFIIPFCFLNYLIKGKKIGFFIALY